MDLQNHPDLVCLTHQDEPPCLNQGQIKLTRAFCLKFGTFVPFNDID